MRLPKLFSGTWFAVGRSHPGYSRILILNACASRATEVFCWKNNFSSWAIGWGSLPCLVINSWKWVFYLLCVFSKGTVRSLEPKVFLCPSLSGVLGKSLFDLSTSILFLFHFSDIALLGTRADEEKAACLSSWLGSPCHPLWLAVDAFGVADIQALIKVYVGVLGRAQADCCFLSWAISFPPTSCSSRPSSLQSSDKDTPSCPAENLASLPSHSRAFRQLFSYVSLTLASFSTSHYSWRVDYAEASHVWERVVLSLRRAAALQHFT